MSACPHYKKTLMLDVLGELDQKKREDLNRHLDRCPSCKAEKVAFIRTLKAAKASFEAPPLGETESAAMRSRVIRELTGGSKKPARPPRTFFLFRAVVPALATACTLLILLGVMAAKYLSGPKIALNPQPLHLQVQTTADDAAIITNMDLLSDLDALNKLARVIDRPQPSSPNNNVQGENGHGQKAIFG